MTTPAIPGFTQNEIRPAERVPVHAMRFPCIFGSGTNAAKQIYLLRNRLKVIGVNTKPVSAQVVKVKPLRYRAVRKLIGEPVRSHVSVVPKVAVSLGLHSPSPEPATGIRLGINLLKESLLGRSWSFVSSHAINIRTQQDIVK